MVEPGAEPDVSVVESDYSMTPVSEKTTEALWPNCQLRVEAHYQQDGRVGGVTKLLHLQHQSVGLDLRHGLLRRLNGQNRPPNP